MVFERAGKGGEVGKVAGSARYQGAVFFSSSSSMIHGVIERVFVGMIFSTEGKKGSEGFLRMDFEAD